MSLSSINRAANDPQLRSRVEASANQEARNNPTLADTIFGQQLTAGLINIAPLMWGVAVDTEAAYESALVSGRGAPGFDTDIITDAQITAAVQAHWPPDPTPTTP
jgi:hypothetical protein